jgi:hypothetical protein
MSIKKVSLNTIMVISLVCLGEPLTSLNVAHAAEPIKKSTVTKRKQLICDTNKSQAKQTNMINPDEWQGKKLDVVRTNADALKLLDRRVQLIGKYVVEAWKPGVDSNTAEFKGTYYQASIQLNDGTLIPIIPPYNKLSLRSEAEVKAYNEKLVKVVGHIKLQADNPSVKNSAQRVMLTKLDGIWLR